MSDGGSNKEISLSGEKAVEAAEALWQSMRRPEIKRVTKAMARQLGLRSFTRNHILALAEIGQVNISSGPVNWDVGVLTTGVASLMEAIANISEYRRTHPKFQDDPNLLLESARVQKLLHEEVRKYVQANSEIRRNETAQQNQINRPMTGYTPGAQIVPVQVNVGLQNPPPQEKQQTTNNQ